MGRKVSDKFTVPICRLHHRELHRRGNERAWWKNQGIDPLPIAASLWDRTHAVESAAADQAAIEHVVATAGTSMLRQQFSHRDHITAPFVVGRASLSHEPRGPLAADLLLYDREPVRLSRDHFAIVRHDGRLFVRDLKRRCEPETMRSSAAVR